MIPDATEGYRAEMFDMEMRLRNGGLGGVDNFTDWDKKLQTTQSVKELAECLLETQKFVNEKFLKAAFAPKVLKSVEVKVEEVKVENGDPEVKTEVKEAGQ